MAYSIIKLSGKQYKVSSGDKIVVDRLQAKEGDTLEIDQVLLQVDGNKVAVGTPLVSGQKLAAKVIEHTKGDKIRVATYKAKSRYRRVKGHRQALTHIEILGQPSVKSKASKTSTSKKSASK